MKNIISLFVPVVGVVFVQVIIEMILPQRRMKGIIRIVLGIALIAMIISPLVLVFENGISTEDEQINNKYLLQYYEDQVETTEVLLQQKIKRILDVDSEIEIQYNVNEELIVYDYISVKVYANEKKASNDEIEKVILGSLEINKELVEIYE